MKYGVIDIGSNSVRLMVAENADGALRPIYVTSRMTRLIRGMENGMLADDALQRTADAIAELCDIARRDGVDRLEAFATSAMRDAENRHMLQVPGVFINVISGEQEAELAYSGALDDRSGRRGVIDIGGGSTEVLNGIDGRITYARSVRMGAVRLSDMMPEWNAEALIDAAGSVIQEAAADADKEALYTGVGGTIHNFASIDLGERDFEKMHGHVLTAERIEEIYRLLTGTNTEERRKIPGIEERRADVLPMGGAILVSFMRQTGASRLVNSMNDNLEGYIKMYMMK